MWVQLLPLLHSLSTSQANPSAHPTPNLCLSQHCPFTYFVKQGSVFLASTTGLVDYGSQALPAGWVGDGYLSSPSPTLLFPNSSLPRVGSWHLLAGCSRYNSSLAAAFLDSKRGFPSLRRQMYAPTPQQATQWLGLYGATSACVNDR